MPNPLLSMEGLPPFSQIKPEHVRPAVEQAIADCRQRIADVLKQNEPWTWDNLVAPLEEVDDRLSRIWSPVGHLNAVLNSAELREAHDGCLPLLAEYQTFVGQHAGLYQAFSQLAASDEFPRLSGPQRQQIEHTLRDFRLSGIGLPAEQQQRYGEIVARLSELASQFSNQVMDATLGWHKLVTDEAELAGLPESAKAAAAQVAASRELQGWLFTLDIPSYLPVMMYADNAALREELYRAYVTRASDQGPNAGQWDNGPLMGEILTLRHELATLLGFATYADYSLATKMAEQPAQVLGFLDDLAARSRPQGLRELDELRAFAREQHGVADLNPWDLPYYAEKLKQARYAISDEALRPSSGTARAARAVRGGAPPVRLAHPAASGGGDLASGCALLRHL